MIAKSGLARPNLSGADKPYLKIGPEHFFPTTTLPAPSNPRISSFSGISDINVSLARALQVACLFRGPNGTDSPIFAASARAAGNCVVCGARGADQSP